MEHLKNLETEVLGNVLSNLADIKYAHALNIQMLVDEFPQSGLFRALLAGNGNEQNIKHAAAYFSPAILHKIVNSPGSFPVVTQAQIFKVDAPLPGSAFGRQSLNSSRFSKLHPELDIPSPVIKGAPPVKEEVIIEQTIPTEAEKAQPETIEAADIPLENIVNTYPPVQEFISQEHEVVTEYFTPTIQEEEIPEIEHEEQLPADILTEALTIEDIMAETLAGMPVQEDNVEPQDAEPSYNAEDKTTYFQQDTNDEIYDEVVNHDIEDEVYDEIVSIEDINLVQLAGPITRVEDEAIPETENTIAPDDHFSFESETSTVEEPKKEVETFTPIPAVIVPANEVVFSGNRDLSMYNDEKMPYTFMWWLDKTRKEHDPGYQPYANTTSADESAVDELQQQYVEHIFNVNGIEEIERGSAEKIEDAVPERKKDKIIKKFIEAEPQIKHAGGLKLNNENMARKSSEDGEEMVTETLARIYTEQMLYPKAIAAYKKLMLKFPEKSLYFAGQIEQLEKKPN